MTARKWRLVVGIGNDDQKYARTYHNLGFMTLDHVITHSTSFFDRFLKEQWKSYKNKQFVYAILDDVIFIKNKTYMNTCGPAVKEAIDHFNVTPEETLVIHDEFDIPLGSYKISVGKGNAGHKGVRSIEQHIGSNFGRARIGFQNEGEARRVKALEKVLRKIPSDEMEVLKGVFEQIEKEVLN